MGMCKKCGVVYTVFDMTDGVCKSCLMPEAEREKIEKEKKEKFKQKQLEQYPHKSIVVTTETMLNEPILERMGVVSAGRVYGMNFFKDLLTGIRDIVGGRIDNIEKTLEASKDEILDDLQKQAYDKGGDMVVAVKVDHTYNNSGNGNILSMFATGTVVKLT